MGTQRTEGGELCIEALLNHIRQCFTHKHKHTAKRVTQTTVLSERAQEREKTKFIESKYALFTVSWHCHSQTLGTASTLNITGRYVCVTHTLLLDEYRDCVSPARPSITMVESTAVNCVSVLFLLDDAGLNKGPPTNTNTGSRLLSATASSAKKKKKSKSKDFRPKFTGVWRFTLYGYTQELLMCISKAGLPLSPFTNVILSTTIFVSFTAHVFFYIHSIYILCTW